MKQIKVIDGVITVGDYACGDLYTYESLIGDIGFPLVIKHILDNINEGLLDTK